MKKNNKMVLRILIFAVAGGLGLLVIPFLIASYYGRQWVFSASSVPSAPVAIVFGAGLQRDGTVSPVLRDRVTTAAKLYFSGKVQKLLMSGDNRFISYNEPAAMRDYALQLGVPEQDIVLDYAGQRTYDTCYRAMHIFGVERAILVSQNYHLPRALLTCNGLGLKSYGVPADLRQYSRGPYQYWRLREMPATIVAAWEVWIGQPEPILGKPEPIFPSRYSRG